MKIKIVRYPYYDHKVGEIVNFGEEKNRSLVSFQKAVWVDDKGNPPVEKGRKKLVNQAKTLLSKSSNKPKKFLSNKLSEKVQQKKKEIQIEDVQKPVELKTQNSEGANSEDDKAVEKKSFWDRLK
ncbi:MAG TPA: hypothetical protein VI819_02465 [Patescibacteria group bacterium]|nr:hypothetical protein [Patescibacteria group bacterium]